MEISLSLPWICPFHVFHVDKAHKISSSSCWLCSLVSHNGWKWFRRGEAAWICVYFFVFNLDCNANRHSNETPFASNHHCTQLFTYVYTSLSFHWSDANVQCQCAIKMDTVGFSWNSLDFITSATSPFKRFEPLQLRCAAWMSECKCAPSQNGNSKELPSNLHTNTPTNIVCPEWIASKYTINGITFYCSIPLHH